eukprot:6214570-Pleurochrysis_carterae.AAC.6
MPSMIAELQMLRASDTLKVRPPGPFWHLAARKRAALQGSGGGSHTARPSSIVWYEVGTNTGAYISLAKLSSTEFFNILHILASSQLSDGNTGDERKYNSSMLPSTPSP